MTSFGDRLRAIADKVNAEKSDTSAEIQNCRRKKIIEVLKTTALSKAEVGQRKASILASEIVVCCDEHKEIARKVPVLRNNVESIMKELSMDGLTPIFHSNMNCGMCNTNDCDENAHWGFSVTW